MTEHSELLTLELIKGVAGYCIALNDRRIAGPKPWGGGQVVESWKIKIADIENILSEAREDKND